MRATALLVKNVLGIEEMRIEPGQITRISGANGSGKSSLLAALQAAIGGGNLMNLKRVGAEDDPEIVLVLDDGRYRIECKGEEKVVKQRVGETAAYEKIRRPQAWLDSLFDPYGANPLTFLNARPADRADILLDVLPLQLDRADLMRAIGDAWPAGKELPDAHPLQVLSLARTVLFDERTGVNRSQKDKASSAYELQKALPAELPADPAAALLTAGTERDDLFRKLAAKRSEAEVAEKRALDAAQAKYDETAARVQGEFSTTAAKIRGAAETKIEALKAELERQIAGIKEATEAAVAEVKKGAQTRLAQAEEEQASAEAAAVEVRREAFTLADALQPDLQAKEREVAELAAMAKNVVQLQEQKRLADRFEKEADDLKTVSDRLSKALEAVEIFKTALLKDLPIAGLEIHGKEILVGGVQFDQLNHGQRIKLAVQVAMMRARTQVMPLVFVDGAESLDPELQALLEDELMAAGVQVVVARREAGELKVETRDGGPAPASEAKVLSMPQAAVPRRGRRVLAE